ncbi:MAG: metal ABC transporter substrate-binding protein [Candidatus Magasanikbacteria bacterium]
MYKKIVLIIILFLSLTFFLSGCSVIQTNESAQNKVDSQKLKIVASIFPLYDLVKEIGGDKVDVNVILPPGASPHTFEVSTSQIKSLQGTKIFFVNGQSLDNWVKDITDSVPGAETYDLSQNVTLQRLDESDPNHIPDPDQVDTTSYDPHYWLNLDNAILIAQAVSNKLSEFNPQNKGYYNINTQDFIEKLQTKDVEWKNKLSSLTNKNIVVFHDAWGYFADHFDLKIVGTFEPFPGQEPTAQYLKELQKTVKDDNIKTLFVEPQLSQDSIKTLASDLGVQIKTLDPLGGVDGRMSYIEMMDFNVNNIYELLKAE